MIAEIFTDNVENELTNDDIWGGSDDEIQNNVGINNDEDFYGVRPDTPESSEIAALRRIHAKQGYLAGIASQKEESLQKGFDDGYPLGANIGLEVGKILGHFQILSAHSNPQVSQKASGLLSMAQEELHIRKVLNKKYFDDQLKIELHPLLVHWNEQVQLLLQSI